MTRHRATMMYVAIGGAQAMAACTAHQARRMFMHQLVFRTDHPFKFLVREAGACLVVRSSL